VLSAPTAMLTVAQQGNSYTLPPLHNEYFRSLSLSKIWLEYRLLCLSCSIAAIEIHVTYHWAIMWKRDIIHTTEVHNVSHHCQGRPSNGHRKHWTWHAQNVVKFGCVGYELCERTTKLTDMLITISRELPFRRQNNHDNYVQDKHKHLTNQESFLVVSSPPGLTCSQHSSPLLVS